MCVDPMMGSTCIYHPGDATEAKDRHRFGEWHPLMQLGYSLREFLVDEPRDGCASSGCLPNMLGGLLGRGML